MILSNALRVLLNHVPYDYREFETYEFIKSEETASNDFIENNNWL